MNRVDSTQANEDRMLRLILLALTLSFFGTPAASGSNSALLGRSIEEARSSQFFQFFNLTKTNEMADPAHPGLKLTVFGVQGRFKGNVNLLVSTKEGSDEIIDVALMLRRDFVDGPTSPFARDVAKSFLEIYPDPNFPEIATLRSDIWKGCSQNVQQYTNNGQGSFVRSPCSVEDKPSPSYLTFLGKLEKSRIDSSNGHVMLQNTDKILGVPLLLIDMGRP